MQSLKYFEDFLAEKIHLNVFFFINSCLVWVLFKIWPSKNVVPYIYSGWAGQELFCEDVLGSRSQIGVQGCCDWPWFHAITMINHSDHITSSKQWLSFMTLLFTTVIYEIHHSNRMVKVKSQWPCTM